MLYFLALGLGFIWIEVVLLKVFVLFLGSPVYSIAVVLFAMLIFAGLGSFISERLPHALRNKLVLVGGSLVLLILVVATLYPFLLRTLLALPLGARLLAAVAFIAPIGFVLGMPFPIGLGMLAQTSPESIPWAWAMNGYATVVGVSSAVLIALQTGFSVLLIMALGVYLLGFLCLNASHRLWARRDQLVAAGH
jgi:hypothetical protein